MTLIIPAGSKTPLVSPLREEIMNTLCVLVFQLDQGMWLLLIR